MDNDIDLVCRIRAYEAGRAIRKVSHRQVSIQPDALVICPIAMAGEDTTVHIMAVGQIGTPAEIFCVPDPRLRDDQARLFYWFAEKLEQYFQACRAQGSFPQLWVSSVAAANHLDLLADRLRYNKTDPLLRRLGELLSYPAQRYPYAGQQAIHCATTALATHWATGQSDAENEHLATVLTWIQPPTGQNIQAVIRQRERWPMGIHTDPRFDSVKLEPLVTAYNRARKQGAKETELTNRASQIRSALAGIVTRIYNGTQRAVRLLRDIALPTLPGLLEMEMRETAEFASFMLARDNEMRITLRDKPKAAAFGISSREEAEQNVSAAVLVGDRVARAQGRLDGHVLQGVVSNPLRTRVAPRIFLNTFEIVTTQTALRARQGDVLRLIDDPRLKVKVDQIQRDGNVTRINVHIVGGKRTPGLPASGSVIEFTDKIPEWDQIIRLRGHLKARLSETPWTHTVGIMPLLPEGMAPADPLAAVEALR